MSREELFAFIEAKKQASTPVAQPVQPEPVVAAEPEPTPEPVQKAPKKEIPALVIPDLLEPVVSAPAPTPVVVQAKPEPTPEVVVVEPAQPK